MQSKSIDRKRISASASVEPVKRADIVDHPVDENEESEL